MIRVSVIIPTYRRPEFLRRSIDSVLNQTFQEFELIVVDDCSGDFTLQVMKNYTDPRICFLQHTTKKGGAAARNTGIRKSQGQYIAFLDDDDEWLPAKLQLQVDLLNNSPWKIGVVYTGYNKVATETGDLLAYKAATKNGNLSLALHDKNWVGTTSSVLFRKECIETVGLFDESLSSLQDYDLWIRISKEFEFAGINQPLVTYHVHTERISTNLEGLRQGLMLMLEKHGRSNFGYIIYLEIGTLCCHQNEIRKAREAYLQAIQLNPLGLKAYMGLGISLFGFWGFKIVWDFFHPSIKKTRTL